MDQQVAVVGQHPLGLVITFDADRQLARLLFELEPNLIADGLNLTLVVPGTNDEEVGERSNTRQIEDFDVGGFLGLGGADSDQPRGGFVRLFPGFLDVGRSQNCSCSYRTICGWPCPLSAAFWRTSNQ